ncbi:VOC family protein [Pseudoclavibacter chungangensis]|uniref:VOC family protein n=1 Tax=Pseudoclavibacter chungangensis TaxID=587635 RepID=A0A7J5BZX6_9MICO|nr:VOC family protein [Pseudoclavibacter chungangensis]KAB1660209.1 VOC family protein [Pseudoclavibacter chungangensis]
MDLVTLFVGDLHGMTAYYRDALGLEVLGESGRATRLGRAGRVLVELRGEPELPIASPREAGLFHTALLFDTPATLASTVHRAAQHPRSRFVGSSDHSVSEAFYFTDPEGNGIELYRDRPRATWTDDAGRISMTTTFLDPRAYLRRHLSTRSGEPTGEATVGHVHLQVGDIATARTFYVDALGFEPTLEAPGALFVSAGGYHHHIAVNVWNSRGAGPRAATLGLGSVAVEVPRRDDLDALAARLRERSIPFADDGRAVRVADPWGSAVTVASA